MKHFRPMLAGAIKADADLDRLIFPMIASPKVDGIRCLIHHELGPVTRKLKAIPNKATYKDLNKPELYGLDGELTGAGSLAHNFQNTSSSVMSHDGTPKLIYWVFDRFFPYQNDVTYLARLHSILPYTPGVEVGPNIVVMMLEYQWCYNVGDVLAYEESCLQQGYEGIMLRNPDKEYKYNRSAITKTQQHLLKLKRFEDAEARIFDVEELYSNQNQQTQDNFGLAERSSHKENMVPQNTLGALFCKVITGDYNGCLIRIGTGFDQALRQKIWDSKHSYLNKVVKFKYQSQGIKDVPRFPVFLGFRED